MKKVVFILALGALASCTPQRIVGNDKDLHGCKGSAGQTWSELKQNCIQVFNEGTRLNPVRTVAGKAISSAFVVFSDDQSKAELFLPVGKNLILTKDAAGNYANGKYVYKTAESTLYSNGKAEFHK